MSIVQHLVINAGIAVGNNPKEPMERIDKNRHASKLDLNYLNDCAIVLSAVLNLIKIKIVPLLNNYSPFNLNTPDK
jgi:hypothetical protein